MSIITDYKRIDKKKWAEFVKQHPKGNIFQTPEMYIVYKEYLNYYPLLFCSMDENETIRGVLLVLIQQESKGLVGKLTSRAVIWGGPLIEDNDENTLNEILTKLKKEIAKKVIYTQFRNLWIWDKDIKQAFIKQGFLWENHLNILHDLTIDVNEQFKKLHSGRRKNINRAEKYGLKFSCINNQSEDFDKTLDLILETYKRVHLPLPDKSFFYKTRNLLDASIFKVFVATFENNIIGTRMVLCYNGLIYDWYAGAASDYLDKYPNDFLPWKIMEWGANNNYTLFDFGGAGKPDVPYGVRDFKLKYGGELINPGRFICIHKPFFYKLGVLGLKLFKFIKK